MSTAARRGRSQPEEEHENHERWLVSYADMITVLMALFIVLFAISQVDQQKFVELRNGLADGFGASTRVAVPGGAGILAAAGTVPDPMNLAAAAAPKPVDVSPASVKAAGTEGAAVEQSVVEALATKEAGRLAKIQHDLEAALAAKGLADRVAFRVTERGLVAAVVADDVFFASARADLQPTGVRVLDTLAPTLATLPEDIAVEGHANHLKISSTIYPTNWELSAARAASVVRHLADTDGLEPTRLSATGFSDTRPLFKKDSARALTGNRRVDLVIISSQPAEVRAFLPLIAGKA